MKVVVSGNTPTFGRRFPYLARGESTRQLYLVTEHHVTCLQEGAFDFGKVFPSSEDKSIYIPTPECITLHND